MKFVDKQLSLKLKEKGFDKPCFGYYYIETPTGLTDGELVLSRYYGRRATFMDTLKRHDLPYTTSNIVDAPTIQQVLKLRLLLTRPKRSKKHTDSFSS